MFFGKFEHRLNSKNQVTVPASFRAVVDPAKEGKGFYLFVAESRCLYLFTPRGMEEVVERARSKWASSDQDFLHIFYSNIVQVECDSQGRMVLPAAMKAAVGIKQDVLFVGAHRRVELWNPVRWQEYEKLQAAQYENKLAAAEVEKDVFGL
jgi:MraZ protein